MARLKRLSFPGAVHHISMRCNNREFLFDDDTDRTMFLAVLGQVKKRHGFTLYDYCLMTNHFHLVLRCGRSPLPDTMRDLASCYARQFNARHDRVGHLWEKRYLSPLIEPDVLLLRLMRYIDLNMWRAEGASEPAGWPWCGYRHWALGEQDKLLNAPRQYQRLGKTARQRQRAYGALLDQEQRGEAGLERMWQAAVLGRLEFTRRMERRFRRQLLSGPPYAIEQLEPGVWGIVPGGVFPANRS